MARLASAHVLVVGVGGVGSWCAEALVRTGVGRVTLMDDDVVAESNVNRQCPATAKTVGRPKVDVMAARLREINPDVEVLAAVGRYPARGAVGGLSAFSLIVDAIDSVDCKARLILDAFASGVPVVSSMGAALRTDPTKVRVERFDRVEGDGLARALRNRFRKLGEWPGKFPCVWSAEAPRDVICRAESGCSRGRGGPPRQSGDETSSFDAASRRVHDSGGGGSVVRGGAKGSIMPVTATFGMCLAGEAVKILTVARRSRAVLSFGSNVEPRRDFLERALEAVCAFPETTLVAASEIEETEPVDVPEKFRGLKFLNRVAIVETTLGPLDFSRRMHAVEDALGRVRIVRNGPRTIDVDLVDFGGLVMATPELTLPHPRANGRPFVTDPWKALVRREMKARRAAVPADVRAAKSRTLCERLKGLLGAAKVVCCYEALATELDLAPFIAFCRARDVEVVFPETVGATEGVPRARRTYTVARADEVDLWICPGLAFTARGERLGFGGGWYDRFLARAKPGARAYGVAYAFQLCDSLPQGAWDRRLDAVIAV